MESDSTASSSGTESLPNFLRNKVIIPCLAVAKSEQEDLERRLSIMRWSNRQFVLPTIKEEGDNDEYDVEAEAPVEDNNRRSPDFSSASVDAGNDSLPTNLDPGEHSLAAVIKRSPALLRQVSGIPSSSRTIHDELKFLDKRVTDLEQSLHLAHEQVKDKDERLFQIYRTKAESLARAVVEGRVVLQEAWQQEIHRILAEKDSEIEQLKEQVIMLEREVKVRGEVIEELMEGDSVEEDEQQD